MGDFLVAALFSLILVCMARGEIGKYLAALCILTWIHAAGGALQEYAIGPAWAQGHLHNGGLGASLTLFVACMAFGAYAAKNHRLTVHEARAGLTQHMLKWIPVTYAIITVCLIGLEILLVTASKEQMIQQGYSGDLDMGDIIAYTLSLTIILANHAWRAPRVRAWAGISEKASAVH